MARLEVTPASVSAYLGRALDRTNYHLFYALTLLSPERYSAVMDALINAEIQPEELVRMGTMTDEEVDRFIREFMGSWSTPAAAVPVVGTEGYAYLEAIGMSGLLVEAASAAAPDTALRIVRATVRADAGVGYPSREVAMEIFRDRALLQSLNGRQLSAVLPATAPEARALPMTAPTDARRTLLLNVYGDVLNTLMERQPSASNAIGVVLTVGSVRSVFAENPGLAQWVLAEPRPARQTQLLYHRAAADVNADGPYTVATLGELVSRLEGATLSPVGTTAIAAKLDFGVRLASAVAAHLTGVPAALTQRIQNLEAVVDAVHLHRDNLRDFTNRAWEQARSVLAGSFPL